MYKLLLLLVLLGVAFAAPSSNERGSYGKAPKYYSSDEYDVPSYKFVWAVKDDDSYNDFGHEETRDGDNTEGRYNVLLPDGRRQVVTYKVDGDSGYVANVAYEGESRYGSDEAPKYKKTKKYGSTKSY